MKPNFCALLGILFLSTALNATESFKPVLTRIESQMVKAKTLGAFLKAQEEILSPADWKGLSRNETSE
jgi:hypothetical protein